MSAGRWMAGGPGSRSAGGVLSVGGIPMSESVAGPIMILMGELVLLVFTALCFGPGEVVAHGRTLIEGANVTVCALAP